MDWAQCEQFPIRQIARRTRLFRNTIRKYLPDGSDESCCCYRPAFGMSIRLPLAAQS